VVRKQFGLECLKVRWNPETIGRGVNLRRGNFRLNNLFTDSNPLQKVVKMRLVKLWRVAGGEAEAFISIRDDQIKSANLIMIGLPSISL
jgi:hypothetical protein